jgi:hypothetical protein
VYDQNIRKPTDFGDFCFAAGAPSAPPDTTTAVQQHEEKEQRTQYRRVSQSSKKGGYVKFWFFLAAMMGPRIFYRFVVLFALGMVLLLYCFLRS